MQTPNYLDILTDVIRSNRNHPALTDFYLTEDGNMQDTSRGNRYTYGEMYAEIVRVAGLLAELGLQKGDHVAICGANSAHWVITYHAVAKMQGVAVTVMNSLMPEETARLITFSDAKALFIDTELWKELKGLPLPQTESVIALDNWALLKGGPDSVTSEVLLPEDADISFPSPSSGDMTMICFTSGTTETPKGVMLGYGSVSNNVGQAFGLYPDEENAAFLSILPFSHMAGLIGDMLSQLVFGKNIMILRDALTIDNINKAIDIVSPYMFVSVPAIFSASALTRGFDILESLSPHCKLIFMGGARLDEAIERKITSSSIPLSLIYGQTETGASISISPYTKHRLSSSGKIVRGMTARIADNGEILVKGVNVMLGYYKNPEATAQKIDKDGWLHTGDRGHLDEDGYLYVEGRLEQDMIVLPNGENIRPENIEALINALPVVAESIVLARDGKLIAIVVAKAPIERTAILRAINPQLPLFSQLYDIELTDQPLQRTEKQTLKRYLYK